VFLLISNTQSTEQLAYRYLTRLFSLVRASKELICAKLAYFFGPSIECANMPDEASFAIGQKHFRERTRSKLKGGVVYAKLYVCI